MDAKILTPDESKAIHISRMGRELGSLYDALWQQVVWVHRRWSEYVVLFGTKESRVILMNSAAPSFCGMLQEMMWESVLLHVARLTDPPKSANRTNLTIQSLARLIGHADTKAKVESLTQEALAASAFCRDWRNRRLAHADLDLALERAKALQPASRLKVREALESLAAILNAVSGHYLDGSTHFSAGVEAGGALPLLHVINDGLQVRRLRKEQGTGRRLDLHFAPPGDL